MLKRKGTLLALILVILTLALANLACDDGVVVIVEDVQGAVEEVVEEVEETGEAIPRFGDGLKIGEAIESATCQAQGGNWDDRTNTCR